jgi:DsbC/DsbD-like thiol-disulfide interchange protein
MKTLFATLLLAVVAFAQDPLAKKAWISVSPIAPVTVARGKATNAELKFKVSNGYHVNSNKPTAEFLIPTEVVLQPSKELTIGKIAYPAGKDFALSFDPKQKLSVYSGDVAFNIPIVAAKTTKPGTYMLKGELKYQACNDVSCFPPREAPIQISVTVK